MESKFKKSLTKYINGGDGCFEIYYFYNELNNICHSHRNGSYFNDNKSRTKYIRYTNGYYRHCFFLYKKNKK